MNIIYKKIYKKYIKNIYKDDQIFCIWVSFDDNYDIEKI